MRRVLRNKETHFTGCYLAEHFFFPSRYKSRCFSNSAILDLMWAISRVLFSMVRLAWSNMASKWAETRRLLECLCFVFSTEHFAAARFAALLHGGHLQGSLVLFILIRFQICRKIIKFFGCFYFRVSGYTELCNRSSVLRPCLLLVRIWNKEYHFLKFNLHV